MLRRIGLMFLASCLTAGTASAQSTTTATPAPTEVRFREAYPDGKAVERIAEDVFVDSVAPGKLAIRTLKQATEKGPFIGVSASPVPPVLRDQLQLKPGIGLVVDFVTPDGPAAKAGLKKNDVMEKLDDQLLVNPQQFAVLVRARKVGDVIKLSIIREAKPQVISVTVGEGDVPPLDEMISPDGVLKFNRLLKSATPFAIPKAAGAAGGMEVRNGLIYFPGVGGDSNFNLSWSDKVHQFIVTQDGGVRTLVAKDKSGKELFNGPITTPEQVEKLPSDIRDKVRKLDTKWREQSPATRPVNQPPAGGV